MGVRVREWAKSIVIFLACCQGKARKERDGFSFLPRSCLAIVYQDLYLLYPKEQVLHAFHQPQHRLHSFQKQWERRTLKKALENQVFFEWPIQAMSFDQTVTLEHTSGKVPLEKTISRQVLPHAPSPTMTSFLLISVMLYETR